jgi:hypothetical protein
VPDFDFYHKKKIADIDPGSDSKVKVTGLVLEKQGDAMIIDDGTGKLKVFGSMVESAKVDKLARVFGIVLPGDTGFELKSDMVQDLSGADINLYKAIDELVIVKGV